VSGVGAVDVTGAAPDDAGVGASDDPDDESATPQAESNTTDKTTLIPTTIRDARTTTPLINEIILDQLSHHQ
jgi:hypothetical protein